MDLTNLIEDFRTVGAALADPEDTILRGWPDLFGDPTDLEARQIEVMFHELRLHLPHVTDAQAWDIAGNTVARFRRDIPIS